MIRQKCWYVFVTKTSLFILIAKTTRRAEYLLVKAPRPVARTKRLREMCGCFL